MRVHQLTLTKFLQCICDIVHDNMPVDTCYCTTNILFIKVNRQKGIFQLNTRPYRSLFEGEN